MSYVGRCLQDTQQQQSPVVAKILLCFDKAFCCSHSGSEVPGDMVHGRSLSATGDRPVWMSGLWVCSNIHLHGHGPSDQLFCHHSCLCCQLQVLSSDQVIPVLSQDFHWVVGFAVPTEQ